MQVEGVAGGHGMGHDRLVDEHRALRPARGAAGEVHQGLVFGGGRHGLVALRSGLHETGQRPHAAALVLLLAVDQQHEAQAGQLVEHGFDLALEEDARGDQAGAVADFKARPDGFGAERGKQRTEYGAVFQRPQDGRIERRNAAAQREDDLAPADSQGFQDVGEAAGGVIETSRM